MTATGMAGAVTRYTVILRRPAFAAVLGTSVVGRLHESMISFGVIMLVTHRGSYAQAGVVMAAYGAGGIVAGPVASRFADRYGHARVLLVTASAYACAVLAMAFAQADVVALGVLGVLAGLCTPPLTPAVRASLPRLVERAERLTAFALESTLQEVIFVAGPVLAGGIAILAGPRAALVGAAVATAAGTGAYCLVLRGVERRRRASSDEAGPDVVGERAPAGSVPLLTPALVRLLGGGVGFLAPLSVAAVALVAQVSGERAHGSAGLYLGLTSAGSMLGGLAFGARVRPDSALRVRYVVLSGSLAALGGASALGDGGWRWSAALLALAALGYGATIAPVGTVLFGRLSEAAGEGRTTEAFGWMGAAMGIGGVVGDAAGGWLVTATRPWTALLVAAVVAVVTAAVVPRSVVARPAALG